MNRVVLLLWFLTSFSFFFKEIQGQTTWRRTYGGYATDQAQNVLVTADGGYLISGTTGSFGSGASDIYVVKVDIDGEPQWSQVYGGIGVETNAICKELDNGYLLAGTTANGSIGGYDFILIRIDQNGQPLWEETYGTSDWDLCYSMDIAEDRIYLGGITYGDGNLEGKAMLISTDLTGQLDWVYTDTTAGKSSCMGVNINSSSIYLVGRKEVSFNDDALFIAVSSDGEEIWRSIFGGDGDDHLNSVIVHGSGDIVAAGVTGSLSEFERIWLIRITSEGDYVWDRDIGTASSDAGATDIQLDHIDGFIITGYNYLNLGESDMIITAVDNDGWFLWGDNYGVGDPAYGYSVKSTSDGGYILAGWIEGQGPGVRAMYVVKTNDEGLTAASVVPYLDPVNIQPHSPRIDLPPFPNPIAPGGDLTVCIPKSLSVEAISLIDLSGRVISVSSCSDCTTYKLPQITSGMYQLRLGLQNGATITHSIVVE